MTITIHVLDSDNLNKAMQLVTESFRNEVAKGWRAEDFEDDWMVEYRKFKHVAEGGPFSGYIALKHKTQPVAMSLLKDSSVYNSGMAIWEWLYRSPTARTGTNGQNAITRVPWMFELVRRSILTASEHGAERITTFIGVGNTETKRLVEFAGMTPVEVEYRANLETIADRLKVSEKHKTETVN